MKKKVIADNIMIGRKILISMEKKIKLPTAKRATEEERTATIKKNGNLSITATIGTNHHSILQEKVRNRCGPSLNQ